jgi:hypothetical protein
MLPVAISRLRPTRQTSSTKRPDDLLKNTPTTSTETFALVDVVQAASDSRAPRG